MDVVIAILALVTSVTALLREAAVLVRALPGKIYTKA